MINKSIRFINHISLYISLLNLYKFCYWKQVDFIYFFSLSQVSTYLILLPLYFKFVLLVSWTRKGPFTIYIPAEAKPVETFNCRDA